MNYSSVVRNPYEFCLFFSVLNHNIFCFIEINDKPLQAAHKGHEDIVQALLAIDSHLGLLEASILPLQDLYKNDVHIWESTIKNLYIPHALFRPEQLESVKNEETNSSF